MKFIAMWYHEGQNEPSKPFVVELNDLEADALAMAKENSAYADYTAQDFENEFEDPNPYRFYSYTKDDYGHCFCDHEVVIGSSHFMLTEVE